MRFDQSIHYQMDSSSKERSEPPRHFSPINDANQTQVKLDPKNKVLSLPTETRMSLKIRRLGLFLSNKVWLDKAGE